jgi:hypothetical protein
VISRRRLRAYGHVVTDYLLELYVAHADALAVEDDARRVRRAAKERSRQGAYQLADLSFDHVSLAIQSVS